MSKWIRDAIEKEKERWENMTEEELETVLERAEYDYYTSDEYKAENDILVNDQDPFIAGYNDRMHGRQYSNPYEADTSPYKDYLSGYNTADEDYGNA